MKVLLHYHELNIDQLLFDGSCKQRVEPRTKSGESNRTSVKLSQNYPLVYTLFSTVFWFAALVWLLLKLAALESIIYY